MNVIHEIRMKKGITQVELAQLMNNNNVKLSLGTITDKLISYWENGRYYPSLPVRQWLAEYSGIPLHEITSRLLVELKTPKLNKSIPENQIQMKLEV